MITISFDSWGRQVTVSPVFQNYANGDRLAIIFKESDGEFWGTLTTNLPDEHLNEGEVFVKDWSENEPLVAALLEAGWLKSTGREVQSGYVFPKVMKLDGPLFYLKQAN